MIYRLVVMASFLLSTQVMAQFDRAKTYQECLLAATWEGVASAPGKVKLVERSCRERFPKSAPPYQTMAVKLTDQSLSKIDIYTKRSATKEIEAAIYNGNTDVIVTQLTVLLTPVTARGKAEDFFDSEEYEINLEIGPAKTADIKIDEETEIKGQFKWKLLHGLGY